MIKQLLVDIVESISSSTSPAADGANHEAALRKAAVVLMIDVARADHVFEESEFDRVLTSIEAHFGLSPDEAAELVDAATDTADDLVSLHEFTRQLNEHLDEKEKARIIDLLWQIAYADGRLDKYEDALVLKIGDLLHVSRGRVMRLKHDAEPQK